jgi:hypothetical protein
MTHPSKWPAMVFVLASSAAVLAQPPARAFPLPSPDGKALAAGSDQRTFHVPFGFARVEQFYRERFGAESKVTLQASTTNGRRMLTLKSSRAGDSWAKAVVREGEVETTVEVTPVLRADAERVEGSGRPLVELVMTRSQEVDRMVQSIDHTSDAAH